MSITIPTIGLRVGGNAGTSVEVGTSITAPTLKIPLESPQPLTFHTHNIRLGIKPYGYGLSFTAPIQLGISTAFTCPIQLGIAVAAIDPPQNPLAVHIGQGAVLFTWEAPETGTPDYYQVFAAAQEAGPYRLYGTGSRFRGTRGVIRNVPVGITAFFQMRAVGLNGAISEFVQVMAGQFQEQTVQLSVRAIEGSQIPEGATFTMYDQQLDLLVAMRAVEAIDISCPALN